MFQESIALMKNGSTPTEAAKLLANLVHKAFSNLTYFTPRDYGPDTPYLPGKIYENKAVEIECNASLKLNTTPVEANLIELSGLNETTDFKIKFKEFNYNGFINEMIDFMETFEKCTSYYKSYLDSLESVSSSHGAARSVSFGESFIFEKEAQVTL